MQSIEVTIPLEQGHITGDLHLIKNSTALVIFAHGSGSSRHSSRNKFVAQVLHQANISTLLFDLLTEQEDVIDQRTREYRFDIPLLAARLVKVTQWIKLQENTRKSRLGYFGASTGAAAALIAAAQIPEHISSVVSRGGRPDLAGDYLFDVAAPTLLIVGQLDDEVINLNELAYQKLHCEKALAIVPRASHLFEEPGTLEQAARLATDWFKKYLK